MSYFNIAFNMTLEHEGGFVNDSADPGGATKYGVSLRWLLKAGDLDADGLPDGDIDGDGDIDVDDIKALSVEDARRLFRAAFWDANRCGELNSQHVAAKLFDYSVNMGNRQAGRILQRACRACMQPVEDDGIVGPKTVAAANACPSTALMAAMRSEGAGFYRALVARRPKLGKFLGGWLRRAYR